MTLVSLYPVAVQKLNGVQAQTKFLKSIIKKESISLYTRAFVLSKFPLYAKDESSHVLFDNQCFGIDSVHEDMKIGIKRLLLLVLAPSDYLKKNPYKMNLSSQKNILDVAQMLSFILSSVIKQKKPVTVDVMDALSPKKCIEIRRNGDTFLVVPVEKHVHKAVSKDLNDLIPYNADDSYMILKHVIRDMGFDLALSETMRQYLMIWLDFINRNTLMRLHLEDIQEIGRLIVEDMLIFRDKYNHNIMKLSFERFLATTKKYKVKFKSV